MTDFNMKQSVNNLGKKQISCWALSGSFTKTLKQMRPLINFLRRARHYTCGSTDQLEKIKKAKTKVDIK